MTDPSLESERRDRSVSFFSGAKCLILGGSGFIGANVALELARLGAVVTRFGRNDKFGPSLRETTWLRGDASDRNSLAEAVAGQDYVFHCITENVPGDSNVRNGYNLIVSVENDINILEACREFSPKKIIYLSSGGAVYGNHGSVKHQESFPTDPISAYGIAKLVMEKYLFLYQHLYKLDYKILRISNPYGRFQIVHRRQGLIAAICEKIIKKETLEIWGDGQIVRDYIHIDDVVKGILASCMDSGNERIFNIGSGSGKTVNEIVDLIESAIQQPVPRNYLPGRSVDIAYNVLDISLARSELNWNPTRRLEDNILPTIDWLKSEEAGLLK